MVGQFFGPPEKPEDGHRLRMLTRYRSGPRGAKQQIQALSLVRYWANPDTAAVDIISIDRASVTTPL
jgi:hypothetical protein